MREVEFPSEFVTGRPIEATPIPVGDGMAALTILLDDGTNLLALVYEGGARFLRMQGTCLHDNEVLEREDGEPLAEQRAAVRRAWSMLIRSFEMATILADADFRADLRVI
jgi:hypothetical protein